MTRLSIFSALGLLVVSSLVACDGPVPFEVDAAVSDSGRDASPDGGPPLLDASEPDAGIDGGPECVAASDCPGVDDDCATRTCSAGACGIALAPSGTPRPAQSLGDCRLEVCDGAGAPMSAVDDTDVPNDGNECTVELCTAGAPSSVFADAGAACTDGLCDGMGVCVECLSASDCPGIDDECGARRCDAGVCGRDSTASGTALAAQDAGDCGLVVCDGAGATSRQSEDGDLPIDGNACTADVCTEGAPSNPALAAGTPCAGGGCDGAGACVPVSIAAVDYPYITRGGRLVVTGDGLSGTSAVTIGGVSVAFVVLSNTQLALSPIPDAISLGAQSLVVNGPGGVSEPFALTVIDLVVSELDCDQSGTTDTTEFIEISTGLPGVPLAGYSLVLWNGALGTSYFSLDLSGATSDANGLVVVGSPGVPSADLTMPFSILQNGPDAVAIYQRPASAFVNGVTMVTASGLVEAVVYGTADADDAALLDVLLGPVGTLGRAQTDESQNGASISDSIQRCSPGRRRGDVYVVRAPTPGLPNACP